MIQQDLDAISYRNLLKGDHHMIDSTELEPLLVYKRGGITYTSANENGQIVFENNLTPPSFLNPHKQRQPNSDIHSLDPGECSLNRFSNVGPEND